MGFHKAACRPNRVLLREQGVGRATPSVRPEREFWPEPDCFNFAGTGSTYYKSGRIMNDFDISSSVVLSNTIIGNFHSTIL